MSIGLELSEIVINGSAQLTPRMSAKVGKRPNTVGPSLVQTRRGPLVRELALCVRWTPKSGRVGPVMFDSNFV